MATTIGSLDLNAFSDLYSDSTQYFWFESNASATYGAGAHVTLVPDTSFISNPTGQNILMNTDGFSIRNGLLPMMTLDNDSLDFNVVDTTAGTYTTTATFTATGAQIGQNGGAHSIIDADGQRFYASDGTTQLANIGYGEGEAQTGTTIAPYYTFGTRASNSTVGNYSMAEGYSMTASGAYSHAEGYYTIASGKYSHAEGNSTIANMANSHAEGHSTTASGVDSHAEGLYTTASGDSSHAEGYHTTASGANSYAGGYYTTASGANSHAGGYYTIASGRYSHAEGYNTTASGDSSHAEGQYTIAQRKSQTVIGEYNIADEGGTDETTQGYYAFIIGNGYVDTQSLTIHKSNALTVDWAGNVDIASGALYYVNGAPISDFVVEQGTSGNWSYRKYHSGIYEAWYTGTNTFAIDGRFSSNSPVLWYGAIQNLSLPFAVTSIQYVDVKALYSNWGVWTAITQADSGGIKYQVFSALSRTSATYAIRGYIKGTYSLT